MCAFEAAISLKKFAKRSDEHVQPPSLSSMWHATRRAADLPAPNRLSAADLRATVVVQRLAVEPCPLDEIILVRLSIGFSGSVPSKKSNSFRSSSARALAEISDHFPCEGWIQSRTFVCIRIQLGSLIVRFLSCSRILRLWDRQQRSWLSEIPSCTYTLHMETS